MGNCCTCGKLSSPIEPSDQKINEGNTNDLASASPTINGVISGMSKLEFSVEQNKTNGTMSSGSRTPANSSIHQINFEADGPSSAITPSNSVKSQKSEKKNFYSRIPPLGRSGSTEKKAQQNLLNSTSIKDNNNQYSEPKITKLYEHYKDPSEDYILAEGVDRLCRDLDVKPEDFKVLVLAWKFKCVQMCRFSREEFIDGMRELKVDTISGMQGRLPELAKEVTSEKTLFKDLYRFTFKFGLDTDIGQRILPLDMAINLWRVVFSGNEPHVLNRWIRFLEEQRIVNGIPRDTWNMFLHFVETVGDDLSKYDDMEAWPSLFDDFVEFEREEKGNINNNREETEMIDIGNFNLMKTSNDQKRASFSTEFPSNTTT